MSDPEAKFYCKPDVPPFIGLKQIVIAENSVYGDVIQSAADKEKLVRKLNEIIVEADKKIGEMNDRERFYESYLKGDPN